MGKSIVGGEGRTGGDKHSGMPKEIITHITQSHAKPEIFEKGIHPKASSEYANCGKSSDCNYGM